MTDYFDASPAAIAAAERAYADARAALDALPPFAPGGVAAVEACGYARARLALLRRLAAEDEARQLEPAPVIPREQV